jgi:hypothetical protein
MKLTDIANARLINQQIERPIFKTVKDIVSWMGALQAQDYSMAKWAIGVRLPAATNQVVETAIHKGEIIRTHILRPTWHFISADDVYWMLALRAAPIKASLQARWKQLGLSESIMAKSNQIMENLLQGGKSLTREELLAELTKAGIPIDENRASHLLVVAELDGLLCSGAIKNGKLTYALLEERVPKANLPTREEALAKLAKKYFNSHGPATSPDFAWWSGLSLKDASRALEMVKRELTSETIESQTYWYPETQIQPLPGEGAAYLLPAYDEFLISYTDRRATLPGENFSKAVSNNGIFRPVIVAHGQVVGIWKRTVKKGKVLLETEFFQSPDRTVSALIKKAAKPYGHFVDLAPEINFSAP